MNFYVCVSVCVYESECVIGNALGVCVCVCKEERVCMSVGIHMCNCVSMCTCVFMEVRG